MGLINKCLIILISGQINHCRSTGVCSKEKSAVSNNGLIYFKDEFCCDNFERHGDGNCYACPKGFTSKARFACTPCLEGTYGFRCADYCQCLHSERCDHVNGCVPRHEADTLSTENSFTRIIRTQNDVNNYQTSTIHMSSHEISERLRNQLYSTIWTSPKSKEDTINGFIDQKVLTYMLMAVAGALVVVIGLCLCLICVCWKRHVLSKKRSIPSSNSAFPLTKFPDMEDDTLGAHETSVYGYEEIDEANMLQEIPVIQQDRISISSLQKDSADSDGYLHPYHSLVSINSNSCKGLDDQQNTDISEERSYSELSAANQYLDLSTGNQHNNEVQQKEYCEGVSEKDHETMYEVPVDTKLSGDKVVFF